MLPVYPNSYPIFHLQTFPLLSYSPSFCVILSLKPHSNNCIDRFSSLYNTHIYTISSFIKCNGNNDNISVRFVLRSAFCILFLSFSIQSTSSILFLLFPDLFHSHTDPLLFSLWATILPFYNSQLFPNATLLFHPSAIHIAVV